MQQHTIKPFAGSTRKRKRIGRGLGSGHGTYSTRGMKGQRARSGGSKGLKLKGMKQMLLRIPKLRGFKSIHSKSFAVNVGILNDHFEDGQTVNLATLRERGIFGGSASEKISIKILAGGDVKKKLIIEGCALSSAARQKIEKAGGSVKE